MKETIQFRLDRTDKRQFVSVCRGLGQQPSSVLRMFVDAYIAENEGKSLRLKINQEVEVK